jgi:hypothetical protein
MALLKVNHLTGLGPHLPAEILSSTVQLGARGEIVESTGSRPGPHDLSFVAASYRRTPPGGRSVLGPSDTPS